MSAALIVRALDVNGDWTFGKGTEDYTSNNQAVAQCIQTKCMMFLNDCFFALDQGIDWFNLLGAKNQSALNLAITTVIAGAPFVTSVLQVSVNLDDVSRLLQISYVVTTAFSNNQNSYVLPGTVSYLVTQAGDFIVTQGGDNIIL
jgi:hypothetical protein